MILFVITLRDILVLIPEILPNAYFPSFMAVRLAHLGDFIERIEVITAAIFTFAGLGKIGMSTCRQQRIRKCTRFR